MSCSGPVKLPSRHPIGLKFSLSLRRRPGDATPPRRLGSSTPLARVKLVVAQQPRPPIPPPTLLSILQRHSAPLFVVLPRSLLLGARLPASHSLPLPPPRRRRALVAPHGRVRHPSPTHARRASRHRELGGQLCTDGRKGGDEELAARDGRGGRPVGVGERGGGVLQEELRGRQRRQGVEG